MSTIISTWLGECSEYTMKLGHLPSVSVARFLRTGSSLAKVTQGEKLFELHLTKHNFFLYWFYSSVKNIKRFWSCNKPFKVHAIHLPDTYALLIAWDSYRPPEKNLIFQAAQDIRSAQVLFCHIWRASRWRYLWKPSPKEPAPPKSFAVTRKTSSLLHKTRFSLLPGSGPTETMANSNQRNYIVYH